MNGMERILTERKRQIEVEGYTANHDNMHIAADLAAAAACYLACPGQEGPMNQRLCPPEWPWEQIWWNPKDKVRNLERAGALYLAAADLSKIREEGKAEFYREAAEIVGVLIDSELVPQKGI